MDATIFINRETHIALAALGKTDWYHFDFKRDENGELLSRMGYRPDQVAKAKRNLSAHDASTVDQLVDQKKLGSLGVTLHVLLSRLLGEGPKVFRPTVAQCEAMRQMSIDLTLTDYQQPYPVIVIDFPKEIIQRYSTPPYIALHHDSSQNFLQTLCDNINHPPDGAVHSTIFIDNTKTLEDTMHTPASDAMPQLGDGRIAGVHIGERLAVNSCLLLTQYATRLNSLGNEKLERLANSKNEHKRDRARKLLAGEFSEIEFVDQNIKFFEDDRTADRGPAGAPTGVAVRPHWRKGHWRRQRHGPSLAETKIIFVRPVLIHSEQVVDPGASSVTYRG